MVWKFFSDTNVSYTAVLLPKKIIFQGLIVKVSHKFKVIIVRTICGKISGQKTSSFNETTLQMSSFEEVIETTLQDSGVEEVNETTLQMSSIEKVIETTLQARNIEGVDMTNLKGCMAEDFERNRDIKDCVPFKRITVLTRFTVGMYLHC